MIFRQTSLEGAWVLELDYHQDDRGFFARSFCQREFAEKGLNAKVAQCNLSYNRFRGTIRGLHYQNEPYPEAKLVRCLKGAIYDVIVDLRPDSKTYTKWFSVELSESNRLSLFVPEGFAHGFQTLSDNCEIHYQMSEFYHGECAKGLRWNDPILSISWPIANPHLSEKDAKYSDFKK